MDFSLSDEQKAWQRKAREFSENEIRPLSAEAGLLPRAHGSGMFYRGLTHVLSILTLGGPSDSQILEGMEIVDKKRFSIFIVIIISL